MQIGVLRYEKKLSKKQNKHLVSNWFKASFNRLDLF